MRRRSVLARALLALALLGGATACAKRGPSEAPTSSTPPLGTAAGADMGSYDAGPRTAPTVMDAEARRSHRPAYEDRGAGAPMEQEQARPRDERPGLGTGYGESQASAAHEVEFERASSQPATVFTLWYDDAAGVAAAAQRANDQRAAAAQTRDADTGLSLRVIDGRGNTLPASWVGGRLYVEGIPGQRYQLAIVNGGSDRYEVVVSVDGRDVVNGQPASFEHRGYLVGPYETLTIEGWRQSLDAVAAFRFSSVGDSYAAQTGGGANIGVVGVAVFADAARHRAYEVERRQRADPFPGM